MPKEVSTPRPSALAKYMAMQIPGLVVVGGGLSASVWFFDFSGAFAGGIMALWMLKDAVMYPIVRVAYEPGDPDATGHLLGAVGITQGDIDAEGWVKIGGELWRARAAGGAGAIEAGREVRVLEVQGLTLRVEPIVSGKPV